MGVEYYTAEISAKEESNSGKIMTNYLPIIQIIVAVSLTILILLQQRGTALGSAFGGGGGGGDGGGEFYATRRGIQQKIYWASIVLGVLFIVLAILNLIIQ